MDLIAKPTKKLGKEFFIGTGLPLVFLLGTILLFLLIAYPRYNSLSQKNSEIQRLTTLNDNLSAKLKKLEDLVDFREVVEENSNLINAALPSQDDIPLLLTQVQNIAKESGLTITNLTYSATSSNAEGEANKVNLQLSVKGSYSQIKSFFDSLEKAARIIDVTTLRFSSADETGREVDALSNGELEISLGLSSPYYFVESKATTDDTIVLDINDQNFLTFINKLKQLKVYSTTVDTSNIGKDNPFR